MVDSEPQQQQKKKKVNDKPKADGTKHDTERDMCVNKRRIDDKSGEIFLGAAKYAMNLFPKRGCSRFRFKRKK